jgi:cytoskeletal protein CcmA (bactofilin family)
MFRNKENPQDLLPQEKPTPKPESRGSSAPTLIAGGAEVQGDLKTPGSAVIEGRVEGTVSADGDVQIGPKGTIEGEVEAKNITVAGNVKGRIYADDKVVLVSGSRVEGDIHSQSLRIEDAVFFQGGCVMGEGARKRRATEHIPLPSSIKEKKAA